jgi:hypothetical protein
MSNPGLIFYIEEPQRSHGLNDQIIEFVGVGATTDKGETIAMIYRATLPIFLDESVVTRFLYPMTDLVDGLVPADIFPVIGAGSPDLRLQQPALIEDVLLKRSALRTERAAIDGMIGIALDVNHLGRDVLGLVTDRINNDAAAYRAVRAGGSRFGRSGNLELAKLRVGRGKVKPKQRQRRASQRGHFQEISPGVVHESDHPFATGSYWVLPIKQLQEFTVKNKRRQRSTLASI